MDEKTRLMNGSENHISITRFIARQCNGTRSRTNEVRSDGVDFRALDWDCLYRIADAHDSVPLVYRGLCSMTDSEEFNEYIEPFKKKYELNRRRNQRLCEEFLFLLRRFRARGIEVIPYKEPLSLALRYPDIGVRQFKDIDFLVDPDDLNGLYSILDSLGFRLEQPHRCFRNECYERVAKEYSFVRDTGLTTGKPIPDVRRSDWRKGAWLIVEPHWSIAAERLAVDLPRRELETRLVLTEYAGERIKLLSPEDAHVVACVVGSKSEWRSLRFVADVAASASAFPSLDWEWCLEKARAAKALRMFLLGNLLAVRIAGARIPDSVYDRAVGDPVVEDIAKNVQTMMLHDSFSNRVDPRKFSLDIFRLREDGGSRLRYLFGTATTPRAVDIARFPLPGQLYFIYWLVAPIFAYLVLPIKRWVRAIVMP